MKPITILAPTGSLGYGFDTDAMDRAMRQNPAAITVDAGSTDPGPHYLGSGEMLVPRVAVERELEQCLRHAIRNRIPLVVGSCGASGSNPGVAWTREIVLDLARKNNWHFKLATIGAEVPADTVVKGLRSGKLVDFEAGALPSEDEIRSSSRIVAQMGPEPIIKALKQGAQVVLAGRACDDAVVAALPLHLGYDPGLALHMGKILECGALCAEPMSMDVMLGTLDDTGFVVEPGRLGQRCTVASVAGHSLYEREDPYRQRGPGHLIDMSGTQFDQVDDRRVKVRGTRYTEEKPYRVKLEGARLMGYRSICIAGIRCPVMISKLDEILAANRAYVEDYFKTNEPYHLTFHTYGKNAVMGQLETFKGKPSHELGLVTEVVAATQEQAHAICHVATGKLLHQPFEGIKNNAGSLAFLYSPSDTDMGPAYEFSVYHLLEVEDECALFPIKMETV
ncbi:MAG: acyclic terpene utilization AtuA family protein [Alphaproteobacteria bacterium]|nr:acyclic terpene utilization AtuA family protein [Alphaproteobacteria bacterium]